MNALKQYREELNTLDAQRAKLAAKLLKAGDVEQQAEQAQAAIQAATMKRRGLLARVFLGEAADTTPADAELAAAQKQADEIAQTAEGAAAARELLQSQIDDINRRAAKIRADMEVARWEAIRAEVSKRADDYRKVCEHAEAAYLELIGAAMIADSMRPTDTTPRCYSSVAPAEFIFPAQMMLSEFTGFQQRLDIYTRRTRAQIEADARAKFTALLEV